MLTSRDDLPVGHFLTHVHSVADTRARQVAAVLLGVDTAARPGRFTTAVELAERWRPGIDLADALDHLAATHLWALASGPRDRLRYTATVPALLLGRQPADEATRNEIAALTGIDPRPVTVVGTPDGWAELGRQARQTTADWRPGDDPAELARLLAGEPDRR